MLHDAIVDEPLGPIDVTVDRAAADRYLQRTSYRSSFFGPGGDGDGLVPCGALAEAYTEMLEHHGFYFLNAVQARCDEEYLRPIHVGEPLICAGRIAGVGTTKSGLVFVDIESRVDDSLGAVVFRSQNRLVVSPAKASGA